VHGPGALRSRPICQGTSCELEASEVAVAFSHRSACLERSLPKRMGTCLGPSWLRRAREAWFIGPLRLMSASWPSRAAREAGFIAPMRLMSASWLRELAKRGLKSRLKTIVRRETIPSLQSDPLSGSDPPETPVLAFRATALSYVVQTTVKLLLRALVRKPTELRGSERLSALSVEGERKTLSGGSLGSCVDEERSQLRELM
jgi:hypothetical protein